MLLYYISGIILIPGLILAMYAQSKVSSSFGKYSRVKANSGITAYEFTRAALNRAGLYGIQVIKIKGNLTDYYDHRNKRIALSSSVYNSDSVAALSIAAHELGHALQYAENYVPIKIRTALVPVVNMTSLFMWPLVLIGMFLGLAQADLTIGSFPLGKVLILAGIIFYSGTILFSLATLPTEFNASRRALKVLNDGRILSQDEIPGGKAVLRAAALTYVASLVMSILHLLRFLIIVLGNSRRRN